MIQAFTEFNLQKVKKASVILIKPSPLIAILLIRITSRKN